MFAQNLYTADFDSAEEFEKWTVIDANADGITWLYSPDGDPGSRVYYSYNSQKDADDWIISPAITPTTDGPLLVRFTVRGGYYMESIKAFCGNAATVEAMTTELGSYVDLLDKDYGYYVIVDGTAGQPVHIGFQATTPKDRFRLYLKAFSVESCGNVVDLKLSEIISPVTGRDLAQETVKVKIANIGRYDVEHFNVSFTVGENEEVTETVNTLLKAGEEMEYTFTAKADLSNPRELYTFTAKVDVDDDIELTNNTLTTNVRHLAVATAPYFTGFEPTEYLNEFKSFNLNEDSGDWEIGVGSIWFSMARSGVGFLGYNYDKNNNADDWMIIEPIKVEPGYYVLKFWYSGDDNHPEKFSVHYGNACNPLAMTNKIVEYAPFAKGAYQESINVLHFDEAQTIYIGFYAFSDKDENWITIDDLSFERIESSDIDIMVTDLVNPTDYVVNQATHDVNFKVKNLGVVDKEVKAIVTIDDVEIYNENVTFDAQEEKNINVASALSGIAVGEHTITVKVVCEGDINENNNSITKTFRLLGNADICYDFEDGTVPSSFTYRVQDSGTIVESMVEEFGETGWGIISILEHEYFGNYMLAGVSWIDGVESIDRWCVLPAVTVNSEDACFTWNAGSINPWYYESYQVRASVVNDDWSNEKLAEIALEGTDRADRGVSLGFFKGKDINVSFRMISKPGEAITFDNLQFFGCSLSSDAIKEVSADDADAKIKLANGVVMVDQDADITVTDINGRVMVSQYGNQVNVGHLSHGVYVVTVRTAQGIVSKKVAL
ncbi:MAG: choice-of-anchor J domain-containing protein [Muribaculaceae bacterium]